MERVLCPKCSECPEVVLDGDTVRFGDHVRLNKEEWNTLVDVIRSGRVGRV